MTFRNDIPGKQEIPQDSFFNRMYEKNKKALYIGSPAPEYKRRFIEWADRDFQGDYGKLLQHLMDNYYTKDKHEETSQKIEIIMALVEDMQTELKEINKRIDDIHAMRQKHKMMSGREI